MNRTIIRTQLAGAVLLASLLAPLVGLNTGCQGTRAQRVAYVATQAIGEAANSARDAMAEYMWLKSVEALGVESTVEAKYAWIEARPEWQKAKDLHRKFFDAFESHVRAQAAAASGETITGLDWGLVVDAAKDLFHTIGQYVPKVADWVVIGERVVTQ